MTLSRPEDWAVASNARDQRVIVHHNGKPIATARGHNAESHAKLISAAPNLLVACKEALDVIECNCGGPCLGTCTHSIIRASIAKAE